MITVHPNPLTIWDELPEKEIQRAIYHRMGGEWIREFQMGSGTIDFYSENHLIEVKRSTSSYPPYATLGQIAYYRQVARDRGKDPICSMLIYGYSIDRYTEQHFTNLRKSMGIQLLLVVSLRDGVVIDLDTGDLVLFNE
jgi:hypothetical protein